MSESAPAFKKKGRLMATTPQKKAAAGKKSAAAKATAPKKSATAKTTAKKTTAKAEPTAPKTTPKGDGMDQAVDAVKGAGFTAVGFGLMALNKAQAVARDAMGTITKDVDIDGDWLDQKFTRLTKTVRTGVHKADDHVESVLAKVEKTVESYEDQLPETAGKAVKKARTSGQQVRQSVRSKVLAK